MANKIDVNITGSLLTMTSSDGAGNTKTAQIDLPNIPLSPENIKNITSSVATTISGISPTSTDAVGMMQTAGRRTVLKELTASNPAYKDDVTLSQYRAEITGGELSARAKTYAGTNLKKPYNPNEDDGRTFGEEQKVRNNELNSRQIPITANKGFIGSDKNRTGTLQHIISGSDLSVFLMAEIPSVDDVIDKDIPKHLWRKELLLIELDSVMSLGYSIVREVFPVRSIGKSKPRNFTRGGTSIAGHMAFAIFTDDVLVRMRTQMQQSLNDLVGKSQNANRKYIEKLNKKTVESGNQAMPDASVAAAVVNYTKLQKQYDLYNKILNTGNVYMLNQLLPFHLLIMGTNEHGNFTKMMIKGVRVIDENQLQGVSQPNIMNKITFAAEDIFPMSTGTSTGDGEFTATSHNDQNNISTNEFSVYSGSQIMTDVAMMQTGNYRLKG